MNLPNVGFSNLHQNSSHVHINPQLVFPCCLKVIIMFDEVSSQKHGSHFPIEFTASLQDTLECAVPLISMPGIKNFVMGVDSSLQGHGRRHHKQLLTDTKSSKLTANRPSYAYRGWALITCIWSLVIRASSSFSRPVTLVLKAFAII